MNTYYSLIDKCKPLTKAEEAELVAKLPNPKAREALILGYMRLVRRIALRYHKYGCIEDLIGYGVPGLIDAIDRIDPERGNRIYALAKHTINAAIQNGIRDSIAPVRLSKHHYELRAKITRLTEERSKQGLVQPSTQELCQILGCYPRTLHSVMMFWRGQLSLDLQIDGMDGSLHDAIPGGEEPWDSIDHEDFQRTFKQAWGELTGSEQEMLDKYYFRGMQDADIGKPRGIKRQTVYSRRHRILDRMKRRMAG